MFDSRAVMICFDVVELNPVDRVMRQLGQVQEGLEE